MSAQFVQCDSAEMTQKEKERSVIHSANQEGDSPRTVRVGNGIWLRYEEIHS